MTFVVVDASVWVVRLVQEDVFHELVRDWMTEKRKEGVEFLSPSLSLAEVAGAISRRTGDPSLGMRAIELIQHLPGLRLVEMDQPLMDEAASLAAELGLRGADSTYVAVAVRLDIPLVTLDVDQKERAAKRGVIAEILSG
jgi:predicted nucleic acid-binding protein